MTSFSTLSEMINSQFEKLKTKHSIKKYKLD